MVYEVGKLLMKADLGKTPRGGLQNDVLAVQ